MQARFMRYESALSSSTGLLIKQLHNGIALLVPGPVPMCRCPDKLIGVAAMPLTHICQTLVLHHGLLSAISPQVHYFISVLKVNLILLTVAALCMQVCLLTVSHYRLVQNFPASKNSTPCPLSALCWMSCLILETTSSVTSISLQDTLPDI